ncbi:CvfB family protein [Alkalicoccus urumqiensis]|nr:S1-like domain-containing RNA-binding protein [Alkalicoccus urumqiensis]
MNRRDFTGRIVTADVIKMTRSGFHLKIDDESVILKEEETTGPVGNTVDVFLYEAKNGSLAVSMKHPEVTTTSYDWAQVTDAVNAGVFVDIGLPKDILVSKDDLPEEKEQWPKRGDKLFVTLDHDRAGRLKAMPIREDMVLSERDRAERSLLGHDVAGNVYGFNEGGAVMITTEGVRAFLHTAEQEFAPRLGQHLHVRVIDVKEDGTINVTMKPVRTVRQQEDAEKIMEVLQKRGGKMPFTDKSTPAEIEAQFQMSKAAFKRALGKLMKEGKVRQESGGTFLIQD